MTGHQNHIGLLFLKHFRIGLLSLFLLFVAGCSNQQEEQNFLARVGSEMLTQEEVNRLLENTSAFLDSSDAVSQIVEQWVTNELLYQEAVERGLRGDPQVQRLLSDNERSVMINALVNRMAETEIGAGPDDASIQTYYEQNREQLALREPFVRVFHLVFQNPDSASSIREILVQNPDLNENPESKALVEPYMVAGTDTDAYFPQSQLFSRIPGLSEAINDLSTDEVLPVFGHEGSFHVIKLVDRIPAGTVPGLDMISDKLRDRVAIQMRKQLFARQVQRLRTRALSRDELEIK